jgi:adenylyltransferase/sulfurtransferase
MEDIEIILEEKDIHIPEPSEDEDIKQIKIEQDDFIEGRYHRLELIPWWDQNKLRDSKIMVVGAGALGNEILKNLALLGVGKIFLIDLDRVENSNLSRSILFRESDEGKDKASVAANRIKEINPDISVQPFSGNVLYDLGLGVFRYVDIVIAGVDNREARLFINQCCWKFKKPYIDGGIEVLNGIVRVFVPPETACYECTMNEMDYKLLNMRKSCALLTRDAIIEGKVPTTPTTSSVIAGIQTQEAIKLIHNKRDLPTLAGKGFFFNGLTHDSFVIEYVKKDDCLSHETYEEIVELNIKASDITLQEMLEIIKDKLGKSAVLEFNREIVCALVCEKCKTREDVFKSLGKITESQAKCSNCGEIRVPELTHTIYGDEKYLYLKLSEVGIPPFDILTGRDGLNMLHFELSGDKKDVLGEIYGS